MGCLQGEIILCPAFCNRLLGENWPVASWRDIKISSFIHVPPGKKESDELLPKCGKNQQGCKRVSGVCTGISQEVWEV